MAKARAISLHIGVNSLDAKHYAGWKGELKSCEHDADDMASIARAVGMKPTLLHTKIATRDRVLGAIHEASQSLKEGDLYFLSYSGHGSQVLDVSGDEMEMMDETWCLHDGQVIDDEVDAGITAFAKGVRVLVISDSSPSGSVVRPFLPEPDPPPAGQRARLMPPIVSTKVYRQNEKFYDALQKSLRTARMSRGPSIIAYHACQHNQAAIDGKENGVFTEHLRWLWNEGSYQGNYVRFFEHIVARMPSTQTPMMKTYGDVADFILQQPFTL
jgi:hypothetical protein